MTELADLDLDEMAVDLRRERSVARFRDAALACVERSYLLPADDLAKPDLMTAGITFATLALVEALTARSGAPAGWPDLPLGGRNP